jgi:hypothetical protein
MLRRLKGFSTPHKLFKVSTRTIPQRLALSFLED